ncbi:DmpA family aminopeptidase [Novacetimonas pomaceti]|uniref:DmpA family aminopeptidase n=1 Tax=Novacetimonas pomaceti TaxID=2021998 RepID=UPI001C2D00C7|nr:P1 family peptidase [Novacetimonas pomaceti]
MSVSFPLARDFGLIPDGHLRPGALNALCDVPGVAVGHRTIRRDAIATGVTAILPHGGDLFREKVRAGVEVINGFGKSVGLIQVRELGTIETPLLLTNTFGVSACADRLIRRGIASNPAIGRATSTINPLVLECNDGAINDIQAFAVSGDDADAALAAARPGPVAQGALGAGTGMTAFGFKGGIGTASRRMTLDGRTFTLGVLVLANFGVSGDLVLPDGRRPSPRAPGGEERGSVIVVMGTDLPLDDRQLTRVARRGAAGLARLGAFWGNGSGDIALCFSTADRVAHDPATPFAPVMRIAEPLIDLPFRAAAEATQEAVLNALCAAPPTPGRDGAFFPSLADWLRENPIHENLS